MTSARKAKPSTKNNTPPTDDFEKVLSDIQQHAAHLNVHIIPYTPLSLSQFRSCPPAVQKIILEQLHSYTSTLQGIDPSKSKQQNEIFLLRSVAKKLGIGIPEDFYQTIEGDEIIEIYRWDDEIQVYRNLEFMKYCTYDFATILLHNLEELFERSEEIYVQLSERAKYVSINEKSTVPWNIPNHTLTERLHPLLNAFEMQMYQLAPGIDQKTNSRIYWVSSLKVKPLGSQYAQSKTVLPWPPPAPRLQ